MLTDYSMSPGYNMKIGGMYYMNLVNSTNSDCSTNPVSKNDMSPVNNHNFHNLFEQMLAVLL